MIPDIPIPNEEGDVPIWLPKRYSDHIAVIDGDPTISSCSTMEAQGREVKVAANLVLHLELVGPVPAGWDGAVGAQNSVLPTILSLLNPIPYHQAVKQKPNNISKQSPRKQTHAKSIRHKIPCDEEGLIQAIEHIDDHIPVRSQVHNGSRKLIRDRDHLPSTSTRLSAESNRSEDNKSAISRFALIARSKKSL